MSHDNDQASALMARLSALTAPVEVAAPVIEAPRITAAVIEAPRVTAAVIEAPAELVETSEIALLPPDAPSRMTPAGEEPKVTAKKGRKTKKPAESEEVQGIGSALKYDFHVDRLFDAAPDEIEGYLEVKQDDGWEFLCWYSGLYPMFRRVRL